ncbi:MAG TPA: hypothetical protein PK385_09970 [Spirochaetota bacterium]|jgi:hypothetical protein|nr:MAG: hypothetical protein BWX91_00507 [Spirochaetes bacterium ADurb.Bin133]HNZ26719.1 hypothetical protein [Spirochaetota bacterium]HOF01496.1 hypothetical protein [Spirochaetota bacterium]HOS33116.1 hypothetical protein [Spirochaetota bacterium]HOS56373.1 hypothetical protein [Spirochaetota bacterium]
MLELKYEELLRNSIVDNKIKAAHLRHIPKLKTCDNWGQTEFIGRVNFKFKFTEMDGGLIKFNGRIYYINNRQIQSLMNYVKWNNLNNVISVIE